MSRAHTRGLRVILIGLALVAAVCRVAIAQLGGRPAEAWITTLERAERVAALKVDEIVRHLKLESGQVIADIGAGPGIFSFALGKAVGPTGKVYAEEVDQAFIDRIEQKIREQHVTNVRTVLGTFTDPKLPEASIDLAFFHDVLHHVEDRAGMLRALVPSLKPDGRVAIIEYDAQKGPHNSVPALQITEEELDRWLSDVGFKPVDRMDGLFTDARWGVIYARK